MAEAGYGRSLITMTRGFGYDTPQIIKNSYNAETWDITPEKEYRIQ